MRSQSVPDRTSLPEDALLGEFQIGKDARTLGASVTNALRNAIIRGKLAPGRSLGQQYLARLFDVSRVPIRESLKQLASEGLVEMEPHKGAIVAHLSLDELDELYAIIWALESLARGAPLKGRTDLYITPGFEFRRVDALLTNFHLPRTTLLALVMAFAGIEETRELYQLAVAERYRFYSFGDGMLVV